MSALTTVYEKGSCDSDCEAFVKGSEKIVSSDDACTDAPEWTHGGSRAGIDVPLAQELLAVFESRLQAHKDEMQLRIDRLEALQKEQCNDIAEALLSESDRWRTFSQRLEEELGAGTNRLYGVENKLWQLENRSQENRGAKSQTPEASSQTEPDAIESMREHIESNSEFVRSFIERESAKIAGLSERLLRSDEERSLLERKLDDVARLVEDVRKDHLPDDPTLSSQRVTRSSASTTCLKVASGASADPDAQSGSISGRRQQRPPVTRTASARASDLQEAERVRRLQSAPVLAPLGSARSAQNAQPSQAARSVGGSSIAERLRSPEKLDGQKVNQQRTHAPKFPASSVSAQSPTSMKRRVSPKPGF